MTKGNRLDLGARIVRFARERAGLSQEQLAQASGISQGLISRYEAGEVQPSIRTVQRLVNAAGVVMTIDVDGVRMIDTTRFPTAEEAEGIDAATRRLVGDPPAGTWVKQLAGFGEAGRRGSADKRRGGA